MNVAYLPECGELFPQTLTVNNDLISITYAQDTPNDLQVVKVLQNLTGGGNITALRIQQ